MPALREAGTNMWMGRVPFVIAVLCMPAGCAVAPIPPTEVLTMRADALPPQPGLPPPGTTWRLDEGALQTLSPAPYVPPPPLMLPYPVPGTAAPPLPAYVPYAYMPPPPLFYFGLGYTWGGHRYWPGRHRAFHPRGSRFGRR